MKRLICAATNEIGTVRISFGKKQYLKEAEKISEALVSILK